MEGTSKQIYDKRAIVIKFQTIKNTFQTFKQMILKVECNDTKIIQCYFKEEPSALKHIHCDKCVKKTRFSSFIILLMNNDIENLKELLKINTDIRHS